MDKLESLEPLELNQEELYKIMISLSPHTELEGYRELQNKIRKAMGFPIGFEYDQNYENVARLMMEAMQYENGMCNRYERESYPEKWVALISQACEKFFQSNPELLTEDNIDEIGRGGEETEMEEKYSNLEGWEELNRVLNHYFDHYPEEDETKGLWVHIFNSQRDVWECKKCGCWVRPNQVKVCECDKVELVK